MVIGGVGVKELSRRAHDQMLVSWANQVHHRAMKPRVKPGGIATASTDSSEASGVASVHPVAPKHPAKRCPSVSLI